MFPINNDFVFNVSEKIIISIVITVISLFLRLPILLFNKLIETFNLPNNFSSYTILYAVLMIASLTVLFLFGMRGFLGYLTVFLAYGTSGFISLLVVRGK